jgi:hypothetical protein
MSKQIEFVLVSIVLFGLAVVLSHASSPKCYDPNTNTPIACNLIGDK